MHFLGVSLPRSVRMPSVLSPLGEGTLKIFLFLSFGRKYDDEILYDFFLCRRGNDIFPLSLNALLKRGHEKSPFLDLEFSWWRGRVLDKDVSVSFLLFSP